MSELTVIKFNLEDGEYEAMPNNSWGSAHPQDIEQYDNIYIELEDDPDDEPMGRTIYRRELEDGENNIDLVFAFMALKGFTVIRSRDVSDIDLEEYRRQYGEPTTEKLVAHYTHDLPPRQENKLTYMRWILEKNHLVPPDFGAVNGELYI